MNKKKKYIIAVVAFVVCAILFTFAIKAQRMYSDSLTNKQASSQDTNSKSKALSQSQGAKDKENGKSKDVSKSSSGAPSSESQKNDKSSSISSKGSSAGSNSSQKENNPAVSQSLGENIVVKSGDPEENNSFQFIDTVNGNSVFLRKDVDNMDGETVGYITERILDDAKINYKCTGSASTVYFAAIKGLEEKKAGRLSGWCYYVRKKGQSKFVKPNVGSGQWIYHTGDIVVWKYLADGIHDGYSDDWK
ncbi:MULTISPECIES: hypothetical protein [Clostridium]|uniref:DUF4430 domain-containing protein n=3 Tax=Clostridium TaxID=1485 RepID=D8GKE7_CLOLD|nr:MULTISPECIES: hypothetical protein [Clostridium]ADK15287.1 conserved hypothetical protein [Clostridium ljungdahlii DSM 13528]ALU34743.1 Hypothetical protein CLAU_0314 [Clostridium autoethanogenum DSM 10061]OAA88769.1 hypothetical protein WX45_02704 [Clostridium ljungdahlii DSM 13528]OVY51462.1 hypothetical protein WX72_01595 [Clostridium autoethanogenum]